MVKGPGIYVTHNAFESQNYHLSFPARQIPHCTDTLIDRPRTRFPVLFLSFPFLSFPFQSPRIIFSALLLGSGCVNDLTDAAHAFHSPLGWSLHVALVPICPRRGKTPDLYSAGSLIRLIGVERRRPDVI